MRKLLLIAGVAVLAMPSLAAAQPGCMGPARGGAIAGPASRGDGAVVEAVSGGATAAADTPHPRAGFIQVGFYDGDGVWHADSGGYYDQDGNWVDVAPPSPPRPAPSPPDASDYGADVAFTGAPNDVNGRETWIEQRVHEGDTSGAISRGDAEHDFDVLAGIREFQAHKADADGGLTAADRADILNKLGNLSATLHSQWRY